MTTTVHTPAATRPSPDAMRRTSVAAGIPYPTTFVSVPTLSLGVDLTVRGFWPSAVAALPPGQAVR